MNAPYSPSTSVPPPLPKDLNFYQYPTPKPKRRLMLSESRAIPYRKASAIIGVFSLLASLLTYKAGWGLNLPLLAAAALGVGFWQRPELIKHNSIRLQLGTWLALGIAVVLHFDPWTIVPFLLVSLVLIGSLLFGRAVDPMRGLARASVQAIAIPWAYVKAIRFGRASLHRNGGRTSSILRLIAFPVFIATGFGTLYVWSNQTLSKWSFQIFDNLLVGDWIIDIAQFGWCLFIGSAIGAGLVFGMKGQDSRILKTIGASPKTLADSVSSWSSVSVALVLVNVLALVLNTVDGSTTWVGEISTSGAELKRGVHAGTYTLITAVVLAAGYLIYNFRVQPKDYARARVLAMAWLGQNLMMCFTVALRNYHYTDAYGLTIKRIGVWLFLCCTATGLYFLGRQVRENGSIERLIRRQSWAVYLVLATAAIPNWPGLITRYNHQKARLVLDEEYLKHLLPYNFDVWTEYSSNVFVYRKSINGDTYYRKYPAPNDIREWDYRSAKRNAMTKGVKSLVRGLSHVPIKAVQSVPVDELIDLPQVDPAQYEEEPVPVVESLRN